MEVAQYLQQGITYDNYMHMYGCTTMYGEIILIVKNSQNRNF